MIVNVGAIESIRPFDPFPFPFLTMTVSLEAIFLALFVLASQNRLGKQADKRGHLDLQINPLAEQEMRAVPPRAGPVRDLVCEAHGSWGTGLRPFVTLGEHSGRANRPDFS